jgi:hypothetical protein
MKTSENETRRHELQSRLADLDSQFAGEMRKRGFDPAQAENLALPSVLARMSTERQEIISELEELAAGE